MKTFLECEKLDTYFLLTLIISFAFIVIYDAKEIFKDIKNDNIFSRKSNYTINYGALISIISLIVIIPLIMHLLIWNSFKTNTLFILVSLFIVISLIVYFVFKFLRSISFNNFNNTLLSSNEKYIFIFSQLIYFLFFSHKIYTSMIDSFYIFENPFICDVLILTYMTCKIFTILFLSITNILITFKTIYKLFFPNLLSKLSTIKEVINNFSIELNIKNRKCELILFKNKKWYLRFINFICKWINKRIIFFRIPLLSIFIILFDLIKFIFNIFVNLFYLPISFFIRMLSNEIVFFYRYLRITTIISIILIYFHALNHNCFIGSAVDAYELLGITIIFALFFQQLNEIKNHAKKQSLQN